MLHEKYKKLFKQYKIDTTLRLAHFYAQLEHESNLKPIQENLNYSKNRLLQVFPKYFNAKNVDAYALNPQAIANKVYGNRMGNGDEKSGDGWKYRGRGFIQLTGFDNYKSLTDATGIDYVNNPDLLLNEADAMIASLFFWNSKNINADADADDIEKVTRKINGGLNGLADRQKKLAKWKKLLKNN